jgi:hypothetical protein
MPSNKWDQYIVTEPKFVTDMVNHAFEMTSGFTWPDEVYIDADLIKEANTWLDIVWVWDKTIPTELPGLHSHPFREIVLLIGSNPKDLRDLGGEVEWGMGSGDEAKTYKLTSTTAIYVPGGVPHGPLVYRRVDRPILNIAIGLETGDYS